MLYFTGYLLGFLTAITWLAASAAHYPVGLSIALAVIGVVSVGLLVVASKLERDAYDS